MAPHSSMPASAPGSADLGIDVAAISDGLSHSIGFPVRHYHDPGIYALELARIFEGRWQYFCPVAMVAKPGDVMTGMIGNTPVVVTRDKDGQVHGLVNVCRHRGFRVVGDAERNCTRLYCRYHAWTYRLDGSLARAPDLESDTEFDKSEHGLRRIAVGIWGPAVFVNSDDSAEPLHTAMPELQEFSDRLGVDEDPENYILHDTHISEQKANWKLWTDNSVECYHCGSIHGESFNQAFVVETEGGVQSPVLHKGAIMSSVFEPQKPKGDGLRTSFYRSLHLFPGAHIVQHDDIMLMGRMVPTGPESCTYTGHYMRHKDTPEDRASEWVELYNKTFAEDAEVVELQQINLRSPNAMPFRYNPGREETSILTNKLIVQALAD